MRFSLPMCLFAALLTGLGDGGQVAHADPITATISFLGTGNLRGTDFTDSLVTVSASFTSESLLTCGEGFDECAHPDGPPLFNQDAPLITISVAGTTETARGDVAVSVEPGNLSFADINGHLAVDVMSPEIMATSFLQPFGPVTGTYLEDELGDNCIEKIDGYCPMSLYGLTLDSIAGTSTGSVVVGSSSAVPEPGTWVMMATGLFGGLVAMRSRWGR